MEVLFIGGAAAVGYILYNGFKKSPMQIDAQHTTTDLHGPATQDRVTEEHPVQTIDSSGLSGLDSRPPPAAQTQGGVTPNAGGGPIDDFSFYQGAKGGPATNTSQQTVQQSQDWLQTHPAGVPLNNTNKHHQKDHPKKGLSMILMNTAMQNIGASSGSKTVGSIPLANGRASKGHGPAMSTALGDTKRSHMNGKLQSGVYPAVGQGETSGPSTSAHTAAKTGKSGRRSH
jgi:hypothetical protein